MAKVIEIEFAGIDHHNRPTFVSKDKLQYIVHATGAREEGYGYFCDTHKLFNREATIQQVFEYYQADPGRTNDIIYKGRTFGAEPSGEHYNVQIVGTCEFLLKQLLLDDSELKGWATMRIPE